VGALAGELSATAVNAPMVPAEVGESECYSPFFFFRYVTDRSSFYPCECNDLEDAP
jgi:hypothetical protein